jgi:hypothetical protein
LLIRFIRDSYLLLLDRVTELANKTIIGSFSEPSLMPAIPDIKPVLPTLLAKDYPKVLFWKKDQWDIHVNQRPGLHVDDLDTDSARKDPGAACKALTFVTDRDGAVITRGKASAIRATCRHLWVELRKNSMAPPTWGQASHSASTFFRNAMYQAHPELRLCDDHWKLDYLARKDYPSWIRPSRKPQKTINKKDGACKFASATLTSNKRTHEEEAELSRKKSKPDTLCPGPVAVNNPTVTTTVLATYVDTPHITAIPDNLPPSPSLLRYSNYPQTAASTNSALTSSTNTALLPSSPESPTEPSSSESLTEPSSLESLTEPSSSESLTEPSSPDSLTEPSSPESLTEPSSSESRVERSCQESLAQPSSPKPFTMHPLPSTTHFPLSTIAKVSDASLLSDPSPSPPAHVPTSE